jgi:hypothetical protein
MLAAVLELIGVHGLDVLGATALAVGMGLASVAGQL